MKYKLFILSLLLFSPLANLHALDIMNLWRHPEIAEKNSVFADIGFPVLLSDPQFQLLPLNVRFDYLPPLPLPFSLGFFFDTPLPNLNSFGVRLGYHADIFDPLTDVYLLYSFNCAFFRTRKLAEYNDLPAPVRFYDFRVGIRRFFSPLLGFSIESGFKLESVLISLSFKFN